MDLTIDRENLKDYRTYITDLKQDLRRINLLLEYSTEMTYPTLILRRNDIIRQISTFETMMNIIKNELFTLSRP